MCGIIGIFGDNNAKGRAHLSLNKITHRGSSVFELEYFENAVLGANRLPIVDREFGKQPKANEDGTVFVAQNGEIFNYKKLKKELIEKGHKFKTDSDTEVLAHLYEEYGPKMVDMLDSEMFAFVIYDKRKRSVFAARDPLGVKPLYYAYDRTGQLYFASELKQLSFFEDIEEIHNFPPGSYFLNGKIKSYFKLKINDELKDEDSIINILEKQIVEAVRKRVDTDLPIGVFLSGGVDSSLVMEIAARLHPDVTAIILGYPGSSDYEFALRLCKERKYKYHIVRPDVDYEKELDNLIYHLETYEPNIIRQSFSLDICAREAQRLGLRVLLTGDGSDELFGGYNEFSFLSSSLINKGCLFLTESLSLGHLQRLDRMSMKHTVEVRAPFFDKKVIETAMSVTGELKVKRENHQITTKYIIRKLAENFLPDYIAWRYKIAFSNGAGMNVGNNFKAQDGDVAKIILEKAEANLPENILKKYAVDTREGKYYINKFDEFNFTKLVDSEKRLIVKDNLIELYKSKKARVVVAEFDRLAIYFPVYFASENGFFSAHGLDVDFIATGGDDKTFASLVNNSAHIGLSDPMFAMFENKEGVKGEIIGELVTNAPGVAIALSPKIHIESADDFKKYKVGTFEEYSTMSSVVRSILPKETEIVAFEHKILNEKLINRSIDVAVVLPEQAYELEMTGGRIIFDLKPTFKSYLFSGFTISNILDEEHRKNAKSFLAAVRESIRYIKKNRTESLNIFTKLFPNLKSAEKIFDYYLNIWSSTLHVENEDYKNACKVWKKNYPELLREYVSYYKKYSLSDSIIEKINSRNFRRDFPFFEDELREKIECSLKENKPLQLVGFWGASNKIKISNEDLATLAHFRKYLKNIKEVFKEKIDVTWILADEHAKANGYSAKAYKKYLSEIQKALLKNEYKTVFLSQLWKKWKIRHKAIEKEAVQKSSGWWNEINIAKQLEEQAKER